MGRNTWSVLVGAAFIVASLGGATVLAQTQDSVTLCEGPAGVTPDQQISGCTALIQSGRGTTQNLAWAFFKRANALHQKAQYDRAIADYTQAIRLLPSFANAFYNRGVSYYSLRQYDRALADYTEAIRLDPNNPAVFLNRGSVYAIKGQYDRAIADFDQAIVLRPGFDLAILNRSRIYVQNGQYDRAISDLDLMLRSFPEHSFDALIYRGFANFYKGNLPAAADSLQSANDIRADGYVTLWRFIVLARMGQNGAAELAANAMRLDTKTWPFPLIEFYLGKRTENNLSATATTSEEKCDEAFYLGQWHVLHRDMAAARLKFLMATTTCSRHLIEYSGAVAELRRSP